MINVGMISLFGVLGVLCRYGIDTFFASWNQNGPVTTLLINILGSFLAGLIYTLSLNREFMMSLQPALLIGFCGGFTTFSAYALQTIILVERGKFGFAVAYFVMSPVFGLLAACIPILLFRKLAV
jgi:fluoride exporter